MARTYQFLTTCGINKDAIRFRQHMKNEMAHYASDCWDAEVECSYGWTEVAGHADRGDFDLKCHTKRTGEELIASRLLKEPKKMRQIKVTVNKKVIGPKFGKDSGAIIKKLESLDETEAASLQRFIDEKKEMPLEVGDKTVMIDPSFVQIATEEKTVAEEKFIPHVIEPSFGIGRIVYIILEHCYKVRQDEEKCAYFVFPPVVAPVKCSLLPLIHNDDKLLAKVPELKKLLINNGVCSKIAD